MAPKHQTKTVLNWIIYIKFIFKFKVTLIQKSILVNIARFGID